MNLTEYWKQLAQEQKISEEISAKVLEVLSHPKASEALAKELDKEYVSRPVFQSQLDRQRDDLKKLYDDNYKQWYDQQVVPALSARDKELAATRAQVNAFEATYGKLEGFQPTTDPSAVKSPSGDFISKADFESMLRKRDAELASNTVRVLKDAIRASQDHYKRFGEPLDVDAWEKYAVDNNLPPSLAYEKYIEPRSRELEKKSHEEAIKAAREEAVRDYQTTHKLPVDTKPREVSPLAARLKLDDQKVPKTDRDRAELFREAWNEAAQEASTT